MGLEEGKQRESRYDDRRSAQMRRKMFAVWIAVSLHHYSPGAISKKGALSRFLSSFRAHGKQFWEVIRSYSTLLSWCCIESSTHHQEPACERDMSPPQPRAP